MRLIDADSLKRKFEAERGGLWAMYAVDSMPTVDAVPVKSIEQLKWERDTAIQQLEEHGIPFCGKADAVAVVRCGQCSHSEVCKMDEGDVRYCHIFEMQTEDDYYCADGERKEDAID